MTIKSDKNIIKITNPVFPPVDELIKYLERIKNSGILTNCGEIHNEFEAALCDYLGVKYLSLMSSGTLALCLTLKALNLSGEVITTPYTSVSTIQAIHWNNLTPVFADVCESDCNIDPYYIEKAITEKTSAILPVHVYGNPCKTEAIEKLAEKYKLKVIYDAAHSFGVKYKGNSVLNYGDLSVLSFHATKVFNTLEGGAVICHDRNTKKLLDSLKNSGIESETELSSYGLNAKMNEFQAAFGLLQLNDFGNVRNRRKHATTLYRELLKDVRGLNFLPDFENVAHNYSYFPVFINPAEFGITRDQLVEILESENIFPRKYFYPLINTFKEFKIHSNNKTPIAMKISQSVLCLPLSDSITDEEVARICEIILFHNNLVAK